MARFPQYVPEFEIKINGERIPTLLRAAIISVSYQNAIEGADRVEIGVANNGLQWLDHPLLQADNSLSLAIGYAPDPLEEVFAGEITGTNASFPNGGMPTLTITAHDFLQRLTENAKDRAFALSIPCIGKFPLPDQYVVRLVSVVNGLVPLIDPIGSAMSFLALLIAYAIDPLEAIKAVRIQQSESDFDFLSKIAKENGWEMYIDHTQQPRGRILKFRFLLQPQDYFPSVTLKWGESLMDFTPRISTVGQVAGVSTRIWIPSIKLEVVVILSWDFDRAAFDLQVFPGLGSLEEILDSTTAQSILKVEANGPSLAPRKIMSELLPRLNNRQTGSGSAIGNPRIKAGDTINLEGLGGQFGGIHRVTSSTHTIDGSGYRTSFEVRKEVWFGSIPIPKGASGLVRVQGQSL